MENAKSPFSNGCDKCPDFHYCLLSNSYLPISNSYNKEQKTKDFTAFRLQGVCKNLFIKRTKPCMNICNECPKIEKCVIEDHNKKINDNMGFMGCDAPLLCSPEIQNIYNPNDYAHQRLIFYYKEQMTNLNIDELKAFAKELPINARIDYDKTEFAKAISEHILNKIIPEIKKIHIFIKNRQKKELTLGK